jgi:hypothetical protein
MNREVLLAEADGLLRSMPPRSSFEQQTEDSIAWLGQASAVIERWNVVKVPVVSGAHLALATQDGWQIQRGYNTMRTLLHQARTDLAMELGRTSVVIAPGQVFDYFDELRKFIETAQTDAFFVDPYLDADFVPRYLPFVAASANIRLLGGKRMLTLLPAVDTYAQQSQRQVAVRSSGSFHDRYLFVDSSACYQSGASFKDGARNAPAALTQITDAFQAVWNTYDGLWTAATVER